MAWQGNVIEAKRGVMSLWQKRKQLQKTQICWILHGFLLTVWFCTGWWTQKCLTLITNQGNAEGNTLWDLQHALHQLRAPTTARLNVSSMFMFMNMPSIVNICSDFEAFHWYLCSWKPWSYMFNPFRSLHILDTWLRLQCNCLQTHSDSFDNMITTTNSIAMTMMQLIQYITFQQ